MPENFDLLYLILNKTSYYDVVIHNLEPGPESVILTKSVSTYTFFIELSACY